MYHLSWLLCNILLSQCEQLTLWQDDMQSDNLQNWDASGGISFLTTDNLCPDAAKNCYRLCGNASQYHEIKINTGSTSGYTDIVFTYDVHTSGIANGNTSCVISWSTDDNTYTEIKSIKDTDNVLLNQQTVLNAQNQNIWIKARVGTISSQCGFFSNFTINAEVLTAHPTLFSPKAVTTNPTKYPTNIPINIPSINSSKYPTVSPTSNPSLSPVIPTVLTATLEPTAMPKYWICDGECEEDNRINIDVIYRFSDTVKYNLNNVECFLYKIFVEWFEKYQFVETFSFCDIDITDIYGGKQDDDGIFCKFGPCLYSNPSQIRRLLQSLNNDGNTTMTIITGDEDIYTLINGLAFDSMITEFETAFLDNFDVSINVKIIVKAKSETGSKEEFDNGNTNNIFNPLYYIIIGAFVLLCCIIILCVCYCVRSRRGRKKKKGSTSGVSDIVEETEGYDMNAINTNTTKNTSVKNKKRQHKRSNTISAWDVDQKTSAEMWQNSLYAGGIRKTINTNEENFAQIYGRSRSPLQSIEMITHNKLYTDGKRKHQLQYSSDFDDVKIYNISSEKLNNYNDDWKNYNFNAYNEAMNEYQQNIENNMRFQHAPHQTLGIDSIQPNIVNTLAKKYNKKNKHKYKNQRKQSENVGDESCESEEEEESSTRTLSDDNEYDEKDLLSDNEEDEIIQEIKSDNENESENDDNILADDIAEKIGGGSGDVLTNMKGLLSFQHINCGDGDKRPTGSVIVHRDD